MQQAWSPGPCWGLSGGVPSYSCSQCGGRTRFLTLASLRTHLHKLHPPDPLTPWGLGGCSLPGLRGQGPSGGGGGSVRTRRTQSVGGCVPDEEEEGNMEDGGPGQVFFLDRLPRPSPKRPPPEQGPHPRPPFYQCPHADPRPPPGPGSNPGGPRLSLDPGGGDGRAGRTDCWRLAGLEAAVRGRLAMLLRAADSSMQRRLARLSWELARADTELLCARARRQHLADGRQEAAERQRSLSRQVDVAVMVIAALRERLNVSENQLEQREREALSIQSVLAAAAHKEACGRVRLQRFIETLLERISLAERLVHLYQEENYQRTSPPTYTQPTEHAPQTGAKGRSAGSQPYSNLHGNKSLASSSSSSSSSSSRPSLDQDQDQDQGQEQGWVWASRQRCRSLGYEV